MPRIPLLLVTATILCAATTTRDYRALLDEPAPTSLPIPVAGIRASQLRDSWGDARSDGRTHEGIDIMAKRGTPVVSATHGIVSDVQWRDRGGNTVSVIGPGGYRHYYAHLNSYGRFVAGDHVDVGDTLGFVGTTGNAEGTSPHLHYGIYTRDGAINPFPLLKNSGAASKSKTASGASTATASTTSRTDASTTTGQTRDAGVRKPASSTKTKKDRTRHGRRSKRRSAASRNHDGARTSTTIAGSASTHLYRRR